MVATLAGKILEFDEKRGDADFRFDHYFERAKKRLQTTPTDDAIYRYLIKKSVVPLGNKEALGRAILEELGDKTRPVLKKYKMIE